jgi:hypothetical protein
VNASAGVASFSAVMPPATARSAAPARPPAAPSSDVTALVTFTGRAIDAPVSGTSSIAAPSSSFMIVSVPA